MTRFAVSEAYVTAASSDPITQSHNVSPASTFVPQSRQQNDDTAHFKMELRSPR